MKHCQADAAALDEEDDDAAARREEKRGKTCSIPNVRRYRSKKRRLLINISPVFCAAVVESFMYGCMILHTLLSREQTDKRTQRSDTHRRPKTGGGSVCRSVGITPCSPCDMCFREGKGKNDDGRDFQFFFLALCMSQIKKGVLSSLSQGVRSVCCNSYCIITY